ncbi:Ig-like domain-containing protein [Geomonas sp. RF6]|uniref:Ig-like domain-containing protein n=1 Tax=Geomonas sp. RF6 TaxID=2897342 RepID=UPI001E33EEB6|nr:Ig-like domain-containing protein [Geomonas sp. RF6]UFS71380.1 Ig-like domain-containing protein [Geomonas sp. RF6]
MWTSISRVLPVILAGLILGCGGGGGAGTASDPPVELNKDTTPPAVIYTTPAAETMGVTINSAVTVTFSEPVDPATISKESFSIVGVEGVVSYDAASKTATLAHHGLITDSTYTVTVSSTVKDLAGNGLAKPYTWTFTTGQSADTTAPSVKGWVPAAQATVPVNSAVTAVFTEPMDVESVKDAFSLVEQGTLQPVRGSIEYIAGTATFKPSESLKPNTTYTASIAASATDQAGNPLVLANATWTFTSSAGPDVTPPEVINGSEIPANGATTASGVSPISVAFNEPVYPFIFGNVNGVPGLIVYDYIAYRFTMIPSQKLAPGRYSSSIQAKDLSSNKMTKPFTWTFTVASQ